jgi:hypothetical protein
MQTIIEQKQQIFREILNNPSFSNDCIVNTNFPKPFHLGIDNVKAIILGADPSNPGKNCFDYVFGLEKKELQYFAAILQNLQQLNLNLDNIYVQNLCPNYFQKVTDENDHYIEIAKQYWVGVLKEELDLLFSPEVPVLVTAWKPLIVVAPAAYAYKTKKSEIYKKAICFDQNLIGRPVFALFRGGRRKGKKGYYDLSADEFSDYVNKIKNLSH